MDHLDKIPNSQPWQIPFGQKSRAGEVGLYSATRVQAPSRPKAFGGLVSFVPENFDHYITTRHTGSAKRAIQTLIASAR